MSRLQQKITGDPRNLDEYRQKSSDSVDGSEQDDKQDDITEPCEHWEKKDKFSIGNVLKDETRNVDKIDIVKNSESFCEYRFASNYGGRRCNGLLCNGICQHHWQQMGLSYIPLTFRVLTDLETGASRHVKDQITPYFISTHGLGYHPVAPLVRSIRKNDWCRDKDQVVSLVSSAFTLASSKEEATAMARGLLTLIFGESPDVITIRNSWLETQKKLTRLLDPKNIYQLAIQVSPNNLYNRIVRLDELSIYDTPFLLGIPCSTSGKGEMSFVNAGNVTLLQTIPPKTMGTFAIVGPIVYAPLSEIEEKQSENKLNRQHLMVYSKLSGATPSSKSTITTLKLSQNSVFIVNVPENKWFSKDYWERLGCDSLDTDSAVPPKRRMYEQETPQILVKEDDKEGEHSRKFESDLLNIGQI